MRETGRRTVPNTYTRTHTYTKLRTEVVRDQFELFLRYTGMKEERREGLLEDIARFEVEAVAAYLVRNDFRLVEVELEVDWDLHALLRRAEGDLFDTDLPGWENGGAPEVDQYARQMGRISKRFSLPIRHWIQVTGAVRSDPQRHRALCEELGFRFRSGVESWPAGKRADRRVPVQDASEMTIHRREA